MTEHRRRLQFRWATAIPEGEWLVYREGVRRLSQANVRFMLGGGFALATFTGRWRNTKDMDFYIHPDEHERAIDALADAGFADCYSRQPYDRSWSHRNIKSEVIIDLLWGMANHRANVSDVWFERAPSVVLREEKLLVLPPEELLWCKIYIMQRDRCDWTDLFNLIYARGAELDWEHLLECLEDDAPLLSAVLRVYGWLCPERVGKLPKGLWRRLEMRVPIPGRASRQRGRLLDSRRWFAADQPASKTLQV